MNIDLSLSDSDIKKIFARVEGDLIYGGLNHIIYSTRLMLTNIFTQLPYILKMEIKAKYPRTTEKLGL